MDELTNYGNHKHESWDDPPGTRYMNHPLLVKKHAHPLLICDQKKIQKASHGQN